MIPIVMGVSGSGKTTLGLALARRLGAAFLDADALHPRASRAKMAAGRALNETDREPWLRSLAAELARAEAEGRDLVVACSALRRAHRDRLRAAARVRFFHLRADPALVRERLGRRTGHFMDPSLADSQFETLEPPEGEEGVVTLDAAAPVAELVERAVSGRR